VKRAIPRVALLAGWLLSASAAAAAPAPLARRAPRLLDESRLEGRVRMLSKGLGLDAKQQAEVRKVLEAAAAGRDSVGACDDADREASRVEAGGGGGDADLRRPPEEGLPLRDRDPATYACGSGSRRPSEPSRTGPRVPALGALPEGMSSATGPGRARGRPARGVKA
jgi:hypothetical protein